MYIYFTNYLQYTGFFGNKNKVSNKFTQKRHKVEPYSNLKIQKTTLFLFYF